MNLCIQDVLKEHGGLFWIDSSIHLSQDQLHDVLQRVQINHSIYVFISTDRGSFKVTDAGMYEYLILKDRTKHLTVRAAWAFLIYRTKELWDNVVRWGLLCSLEPLCIASPVSYTQELKPSDDNGTRNSHLLTNILFQNLEGSESTQPSAIHKGEAVVAHQHPLQVCFSYHPPFNQSLSGKSFRISEHLWQAIQLREFVDISDITADDLAFVIGSSHNHFEESKDAIASIQHWYPNRTILFYDIEPDHLIHHQMSEVRLFLYLSKIDKLSTSGIRSGLQHVLIDSKIP